MDTVSQVDTLSTHVLLMHHLDIICEFGNLTNLVYNEQGLLLYDEEMKEKNGERKRRRGEETDRQTEIERTER